MFVRRVVNTRAAYNLRAEQTSSMHVFVRHCVVQVGRDRFPPTNTTLHWHFGRDLHRDRVVQTTARYVETNMAPFMPFRVILVIE